MLQAPLYSAKGCAEANRCVLKGGCLVSRLGY